MTNAGRTCPQCGATWGAEVIFCPNDRTRLDVSAGELTGQIVGDRYRIISRIGEGGMGEVYLAEHVHMKRKCAVKILNPELAGDAGALKRFMREAANASRIDHPNVVTVYDFGEMPNRGAYIAMEYIEGESLRKRGERQAAIPRDVLASIIRQTASALHAAHALGIVHRDLKPDNIMLVERDGELRVKVVDFGIAKAKSDKTKVTATGALVGTPDYMSPEQLMADEVTGAADQYALALVAVKMLTGKLPFATTTSIESMTSRLKTAPMPLRELRRDIAWPQPLQDCIGRALAMEPAARFASVADFSRAFDKTVGMTGAMAATVPDLKVPPPIVERPIETTVAEPIKRSFAPLAIGVGVVLALGGGGAVWWVGRAGPVALPAPGASISANSTQATAPAAPPSVAVQPEVQAQGAATRAPGAPDTPGPVVPPASLTAESGSVARPSPEASRPTVNETEKRLDTTGSAAVPATAAARETPVVPEMRAPGRDTTPPAGATPGPAPAPSAAATVSATEFTSEYSAIRSLVVADALPAQLNSAVTRVNALLPRVGGRADSIRLLYVRAQALASLEDQAGACRTLASALGIAAGLPIEATLKATSQRLSCP